MGHFWYAKQFGKTLLLHVVDAEIRYFYFYFFFNKKRVFHFNASRLNHLQPHAGDAHSGITWGDAPALPPPRPGCVSLPCNTTMPCCCWQIAAGTHFLETRCLRAFSQQALLPWAPLGLRDIPGAQPSSVALSSALSTPLSTIQSSQMVNIWLCS